jgi:uncharacterized Zn-binding protein involved in type VI secretion
VAVVRRAQQAVGAVSGIIGAIDGALDMGFAALTSPLAAVFPSLPAATLGSLYVGTPHTHTHPPSLIPPAPPVPLPSLGSVMLGVSVQVHLGGMPAARAGDKGLAPTCGGFTPFFEIKLASSNVFIGGKRAARMTDMCQACKPGPPNKPPTPATGMLGKLANVADVASQVVEKGGQAAAVLGMAADLGEAAVLAPDSPALAAGKAMAAAGAAAQMAADLAAASAVVGDPGVPPSTGAIVVPGAPTVMIGGFPMIPTFNFASGLLNKLAALSPRRAARLARQARGPEG